MKEKPNSISRLLTFIFPLLLFTAGLLVVEMCGGEGGGGGYGGGSGWGGGGIERRVPA